MSRIALLLAFVATPLWAADVPSGQSVTLHEVLVDEHPGTTYLRFRFLAPMIGASPDGVDYEVTGADMLFLCETLALPYISDFQLEGDRIIISMMDRVTEFAVPDPDATQVFEAFRPVDGTCMWDDF
ncbi:DUF6497 family protein [Sulfitobacter sp. HNIBRBA3233]|uniref:DUF6497 family protein n=1 Tax=Sulfitobacter marinivivus TaxID=3158558 RepID=UPI0032E052D3